MPMGTDPVDVPETEVSTSDSVSTTPASTDDKDAQLAALKAQLDAATSTVSQSQEPETVEDPRDAIIAQLKAQLDQVTADSAARSAVAKPETEEERAARVLRDFTHYVHLADGRVIKAIGSVTRWHDSDHPDDAGIPVIGVYPRH